MSEFFSWDDIAVPKADMNVRQLPMISGPRCFLGRDLSGSCLFILELQGDHTTQFRKGMVAVHGLDVDLRRGVDSHQLLVLTLDKQVDRDLFEALCRSLRTALGSTVDSASSLAVALTHIRRWKAFLSGRIHRLSTEEIRGLYGEIVFLKELIDSGVNAAEAVESWLGPEKSHQDFIFGNTAVEVKSLSGAERSTIHFSSEDQLESLNDALFLRVYRLSILADSKNALSLNDLIESVRSNIVNAEAIESFEGKLLSNGYAPLPEYDQPRMIVSAVHSYEVRDDFPRLVRSRIPIGITRVNYEVQIETISTFVCENSRVFGRA